MAVIVMLGLLKVCTTETNSNPNPNPAYPTNC